MSGSVSAVRRHCKTVPPRVTTEKKSSHASALGRMYERVWSYCFMTMTRQTIFIAWIYIVQISKFLSSKDMSLYWNNVTLINMKVITVVQPNKEITGMKSAVAQSWFERHASSTTSVYRYVSDFTKQNDFWTLLDHYSIQEWSTLYSLWIRNSVTFWLTHVASNFRYIMLFHVWIIVITFCSREPIQNAGFGCDTSVYSRVILMVPSSKASGQVQ